MRHLVAMFFITKLSFCVASTHSWGERTQFYNHYLYDRTLIDDKNSVPKDYTIIYKYYGAHYHPVAYIEIDVNTNSNGYIHMRRDTQESYFKRREDMQIFDGRVDIKNALNVTAILRIYGMGMILLQSMGLRKLETTKSLTFVHVKNSTKNHIGKQFEQNSIGTRRDGDQLLHFESRNIGNSSQFPSRAFEYSGPGDYITYVGFSFDSPTAMVMINTTFVNEKEFNAVVYDINRERFVANMSVYGIRSSSRPYKFLGVI